MNLRQSLYQLSCVETNKYLLNLFRNKVVDKLEELKKEEKVLEETLKWHTKNKPEKKDAPDLIMYILTFYIVYAIVGVIFKSFSLTFKVIICIIIAIFFFYNYIKKSDERENYLAKLRKHEKEKKEYISNANIKKNEQNKCKLLISSIDSKISHLNTKLNKLYNEANIYYKYRNLTAVATMYDYIASGMLTTLGGPNGAYKFYEEQAMRGYIATSIHQMVEKNSKNQRFLEEKVNTAISQASSMEKSLKAVNENYAKLDKELRSITYKES